MNRLNPNADCTTTPELALYLLGRINELTEEYRTLDAGDSFRDYIEGLIAGFETVLMKIGYPTTWAMEHEAN